MVNRSACILTLLGALAPWAASAQSSTTDIPAADQTQAPIGQRTAERAEQTARRFGLGVQGGVGIDPEIIDVGVHLTIGPVFRSAMTFRPGLEVGAGEVTTLLAINLDVLYSLDRNSERGRWSPYVGAGPTFGLSHRGFSTDDAGHVDTVTGVESNRQRFDFGDTDFNAGMNFVAGLRTPRGPFVELKTTAWGVSNIRLLAGFNF